MRTRTAQRPRRPHQLVLGRHSLDVVGLRVGVANGANPGREARVGAKPMEVLQGLLRLTRGGLAVVCSARPAAAVGGLVVRDGPDERTAEQLLANVDPEVKVGNGFSACLGARRPSALGVGRRDNVVAVFFVRAATAERVVRVLLGASKEESVESLP
jgi:hypothetical protein